jgi:hypothetical protein
MRLAVQQVLVWKHTCDVHVRQLCPSRFQGQIRKVNDDMSGFHTCLKGFVRCRKSGDSPLIVQLVSSSVAYVISRQKIT